MVWLYTNMALDNDEKLDGMCSKCREEVTSHSLCTRCGKKLDTDGETFVNPNFDKEKFDKYNKSR